MTMLLAIWLSFASAQEATPEVVWAKAEVKSVRFADDTVAGPTFERNAQLEVILREGNRVRVRQGDDYGWIPASTVTTEAPPTFDAAELEELMKGMDLGGGR